MTEPESTNTELTLAQILQSSKYERVRVYAGIRDTLPEEVKTAEREFVNALLAKSSGTRITAERESDFLTQIEKSTSYTNDDAVQLVREIKREINTHFTNKGPSPQ